MPEPTPSPTPETPVTTPEAAAPNAAALANPSADQQQAQTTVTTDVDKISKIEKADKGINLKFIELIYNTGTNKDKNVNSFPIFNGKDRIKISIFLVNKFLYAQNKDVNFIWNEEDEKRNIIELLYEKDVEEICLEDSLDEIALRGSLILRCEGARFQGVLENYMQYDLVIGFTLSTKKDERTYLEPYIFNILNVKQLSKPSDLNKRYAISFLDILSYAAMNHSFASVRKLAQGALASAQNYETLFNTVYDYLVSFLQRFTLGSFTYNKINFLENNDVDTSELVKMTVDKIPQNATVYDALKIIAYDACTPINIEETKLKKIKEDFELFENDGIALVPMFFKDEYLLHSAAYEIAFETEKDTVKDKINEMEMAVSSKSTDIALRSLFKRNISMPFVFAFSKQKIIFESLNPDEEKKVEAENNTEIDSSLTTTEESFTCLNGQRVSPITSMTTNFIDMTINNKRWKNMIFLYESQEKGDGNFLLRFNWIFNLYNQAMLNQATNSMSISTNIIPDFYINEKIGLANGSILTEEAAEKAKKEEANQAVSQSNNTETAEDSADKEKKVQLSEKDFHEFNANTFLIRCENPTKETQYHIGKMLTSFIMLNTAYSYVVEGSLFRRPNEIVKINRHLEKKASMDPNSNAPSGLNYESKYTMVYITNVKHQFRGKSFLNLINANKIYDSLSDA